MNQNSRTQNVVRNIVGGVGGQIFTSILQFVCRTIFIRLLGATYLGVNGLFANILSMLSLAELGIGPAIVFSMYKPIAENDEIQIAKLMNFYKQAYRVVAGAVLVIGLCLTPFLDFFIKDTQGIEDLQLIFLLILGNTVVSYLFAYKGSMFNADQKAYVVVIIRNIFSVVQNVAQILVLLITKNFLLYLVVQIITTFLGNLALSWYVDKKYPFLLNHPREKLTKEETKDIFRRVRGMMMHKVGGFVLNGTDNLVISKFVGVVSVGVYSNYSMIITLIKSYLSVIVSPISASVGNLIATESDQKKYEVFCTSLFAHFWIYCFCYISFRVIFRPFILLWVGQNMLLGNLTLIFVLLVFYLYGVHHASDSFTNASGRFWETRWKPVIESIINIVASVILVKQIGIAGVFVGSVIAYLLTGWAEPFVLFRKEFKRSFAHYLIPWTVYLAVTVSLGELTNWVCQLLTTSHLLGDVLLRIVICIILPNALIILLFGKTQAFHWVKTYAKAILMRRKK